MAAKMSPESLLNELLVLDGKFVSLYEAVQDEGCDDETRRLFDKLAVAFYEAITYLQEP